MAPWRRQGAESGQEQALTFGVGMAVLSLLSTGRPAGQKRAGVCSRKAWAPRSLGNNSDSPVYDGHRGFLMEAEHRPQSRHALLGRPGRSASGWVASGVWVCSQFGVWGG